MTTRFVTATGTGIGKTLVTAALCYQLRAQGRAVRALKPVLTGLAEAPLAETDPGVLLQSQGAACDAQSLTAIAPFRFTAPLAPSMAAAREGTQLDVETVLRFCQQANATAQARGEILLIEGIGGLMVPLAPRVTVLDWMAALGAPVLLVTGTYLGALSHTLTALLCLKVTGLPLMGLVVNETPDSPVNLAETIRELGVWAGDAPVVGVPRIPGPDPWRRAPDLTMLAN